MLNKSSSIEVYLLLRILCWIPEYRALLCITISWICGVYTIRWHLYVLTIIVIVFFFLIGEMLRQLH